MGEVAADKMNTMKSLIKHFLYRYPAIFSIVYLIIAYFRKLIWIIQSFPNQVYAYFYCGYVYKTQYQGLLIGFLETQAIGPYAQKAECFLRQCRIYNWDPLRDVVLIQNEPVNAQLDKMIRRVIRVETNVSLFFAIKNGGMRWLKKKGVFIDVLANTHNAITHNAIIHNDGLTYFPDSPSSLQFTSEEEVYGQHLLKKIGWREEKPIITIHNKDGFYWESHGQKKKWDLYRDSDFETLKPSISYLQSQGFDVVRAGHYKDASGFTYLSLNRLSKEEHAFMDIFLQFFCVFSICGNSGITSIPYLFKTPVLIHNMIPLGDPPILEKGIYIPKLLRNRKTKNLLPFSELHKKKTWLMYQENDYYHISKISGDKFRSQWQYDLVEIDIEDNSAELILDTVKDMILYSQKKLDLSPKDIELQKKFRLCFPVTHPMRHTLSLVSPSFLRKYQKQLF